MNRLIGATQENDAKSWSALLFPSVLLAPLFWMGWFSVLWLLFFIMWIYYFLRFLMLVIPNCASCIAKKPAPYALQIVLRVLLPSVIIPGAFLLSRQSCYSAYAFAVDVSQDIQNQLDQGGVCPEHIDGWGHSNDPENTRITYYGKYGAKYKVTYTVNSEQQTFTILVPHSVDYSFAVKGGKNVELTSTFSGAAEVPLDYYKKPRLF